MRKLASLFLFFFLSGCATASSTQDNFTPMNRECRGCSNVAEMMRLFESDQTAAQEKYEGHWVRLGGEIASVTGSGAVLELQVSGPDDSPVSFYLQAEAEKQARRDWTEWVVSHNPGDVVEANCLVKRLNEPSGTPHAVNCLPSHN